MLQMIQMLLKQSKLSPKHSSNPLNLTIEPLHYCEQRVCSIADTNEGFQVDIEDSVDRNRCWPFQSFHENLR
jgi:hypothetical protein